ncbi:EamA family transporter [Aeromonas salmonicida]|uniref:DMT superfamily transport protein n=1 Tax=Aeromonas salmonicida subsp. pectinolytica 34mel TaxID=1324960 RepID=A0A2D1QLG9_AERSA|nr:MULTISPECIES: DMT family transporter [Aeromonas]MBP9662466.1 DMT family transporter [Aeromonas sp.]ATP11249.1 DMT superfamily transport protein [Aeromonas salmonicida subsp. pectinolytica 34mel]TNI15747.1 EamA family transporter [Aeromonas salmonicida]UUI60784.1 DMT family transporter [Aeromonas salmonicida]HEH9396658.1 DMT family transporter [Aeromonas salmonicida]
MRSNMMLLMAAAIWGLGFVAQRLGMDHMGPYTFNGLRFLLGAASLLPLLWWLKSRQPAGQSDDRRLLLTGGLLAGAVLFSAASLQQVGLLYTTAAKAGFITGLYIILVPVIGLALRHKTGTNTWVGALIAMAGLYYLSVTEDFTIGYGDLLQVAGALFWAIHLLVLDHYSSRVAPIRLASVQFLVCGLLSLAVAFTIEMPTISGAVAGWQALLYAGLVSVGVGYTLQVVGQRGAHPAHAAIILSLETVFAAIGGVLLLGEILDERAIVGCALMLAGMLISQVRLRWWWKSRKDRLPKQG